MDVLPPSIEILDANGRRCSPLRTLKRVDAPDRWDEEAWDQIIVENVELLAESLREADVLAKDATLKVLSARRSTTSTSCLRRWATWACPSAPRTPLRETPGFYSFSES